MDAGGGLRQLEALGATELSVVAFTVTGARITRIAIVIDPAKLASMDLPSPE
ncbi:hypothetical protein ACI2L4_02395 [Streptomyces sparsogenes]|uniref:hypothetical protein n=1 Tax=Streptomyces sparsogenes TaxID=67365 RepID=UPI0033E89AEE